MENNDINDESNQYFDNLKNDLIKNKNINYEDININLIPLPTAIVEYNQLYSTYTYLLVNSFFSDIFNKFSTDFINKEIGFLDNEELSDTELLNYFLNNNSDLTDFDFDTNISDNSFFSNSFLNNYIFKINKINEYEIQNNNSLNKSNYYIKTFLLIGHKTNKNKLETNSYITLNNIIDNIPVYLYWKDTKNKYLGSNNKLSTFLVNNIPINSSLDFGKNYIENTNTILLGGKSIENVLEEFIIENKIFIFKSSKIPIKYKNTVLAILYIYIDLTQEINELKDIKNKEKEYKKLIDDLYKKNVYVYQNKETKDYEIKFGFNNEKDTNNLNEIDKRKIIEFEHNLKDLNKKTNKLYEKIFEAPDAIIKNLSTLDENQNQDKIMFIRLEKLVNENKEKLDKLENAIRFITFIQNLTIKQILSFFIVISLLVSGLNYLKIDIKFLKKLKDNIEKII